MKHDSYNALEGYPLSEHILNRGRRYSASSLCSGNSIGFHSRSGTSVAVFKCQTGSLVVSHT